MESLLCSGKKESIELSLTYMESSNAMESSTQSMSSSVGSLGHSQIPYERAVGMFTDVNHSLYTGLWLLVNSTLYVSVICLCLIHRYDTIPQHTFFSL